MGVQGTLYSHLVSKCWQVHFALPQSDPRSFENSSRTIPMALSISAEESATTSNSICRMVDSIPSLPVSADGTSSMPSLSISAEQSAATSKSIPEHVACRRDPPSTYSIPTIDSHSAGTTKHDGGSNWISQIQQEMLLTSVSKSHVDSLANVSSSVPYLHTSHRVESRRNSATSRILREADCMLISKSLDLPIYKPDDSGPRPAKVNKAKKMSAKLEQGEPTIKKVVNVPITIAKNESNQKERGTQYGLLDKTGSQINGQHLHEEKTEKSIQCKQHCEQTKPNAQVSHMDDGKATLPSTTPRACSIEEPLYKVITVSTWKVSEKLANVEGFKTTSEDDTRDSYGGIETTNDSTSRSLQTDVSTSEQMQVKSSHEMGMQQLSPVINNARTSMATDLISSITDVGQFTTTSAAHSGRQIYRTNPQRSTQDHCRMPLSSNTAHLNSAESRSKPGFALGDRSTKLNAVYIDTREAEYKNTQVLEERASNNAGGNIRPASPTKSNRNIQQETSLCNRAPPKGSHFTSKETTTQTSISRPLDVNSDKKNYHDKIKSLENELSGIRNMLEDTKSKRSNSAGEHPMDIPSSIAVPAQRENYTNASPTTKCASDILSKNSHQRRSEPFEPDSFSPNSSWCGDGSISVAPIRRRSSCQLLQPRQTQGRARKR